MPYLCSVAMEGGIFATFLSIALMNTGMAATEITSELPSLTLIEKAASTDSPIITYETEGQTYHMTSHSEGYTDAPTQILEQSRTTSSNPAVTVMVANGISPTMTSISPSESKSISSGVSKFTSGQQMTTEGNSGIGDNTKTQQTISTQSVRTAPHVAVRTCPGQTYDMTSHSEGYTDAPTQILEQSSTTSSNPAVTVTLANGISPTITSNSPSESKSISSGVSKSTSGQEMTTEGNSGIGDNTNTQQTISSQSVRTAPHVAVRTCPEGAVVALAILLAIMTVSTIITSIQCVLQRRTIKALKRRPYHVDQSYIGLGPRPPINMAYEHVDISSSTERTVSHNPKSTHVYENQKIINQTDQMGRKMSELADHDHITSI